MPSTKLASAGLVAPMLSGGVAACGDSSTATSTTTAAAATGSPAVAAAEAMVANYTATQPAISLPPIGTPVPKGKTVAITNMAPVCAPIEVGAVQYRLNITTLGRRSRACTTLA